MNTASATEIYSHLWQRWNGEVRAHRANGDISSKVNLMRWKTK